MATITSLGIGSGIDIDSVVTQLIDSEKSLPELRMNTREAELQAELSSVGTLKGALSGFQSRINELRTASGASGLQATSSDRNVLTTSISPTAEPGQYDIEVKTLAKSQTLVSGAVETESSEIGTGTLSFSFGTTSYDTNDNYTGFAANTDKATKEVVITDGSLTGIRDAVNEANIGVNASIVNVGPEGYKLLFSVEDVGENNSLEISVNDSDGDHLNGSGLSQLAYNIDATNMSETARATHAELLLNGLSIKRDSNTVSDLIKGVTLNLNAVSEEGKPVSINVTKDLSALKAKVQDFVGGFNEMMDTVTALTAYDAETQQGGVLLGDAVMRSFTTQLRRIMGEGIRLGDNQTLSLADVGVTTQADGKLSFDEETFEALADKDPNIVANLFSMTGNTQGDNLRYLGVSSKTEVGTYRLSITQVATQAAFTGGGALNDASFEIDASNDTLTVKVDGIESGEIKLTQKAYGSAEALAAHIQASINSDAAIRDGGASVSVSIENDRVVISSDLYGSSSEVDVLSANGLGLAGGNAEAGLDVAGSFGEGTAKGDGQILTGATGAVRDLVVEFTGSSPGAVGAVTTSRGYADKLYNFIEGFLEDDGGLEGKTRRIQDGIIDINEQRVSLNERLLSMERRLRAQFGAMDALVAQLQSTGNFLTQQLESLPKIEARR